MSTDSLKLEAQQVLDELMRESLIPFKLTAGKIVSEDSLHYTVHFFDSRLRSVNLVWEAGQSFKDLFRAAVLDGVTRVSGPLYRKKPE